MEDVFFGMLLVVTVLIVVGSLNMSDFNSDFQKLKKYQGYVVVEKNNPFIFERNITLRKTLDTKADTLSMTFKCEQLMYENISVGDTISQEHYTKYNNIIFE